MNVSWNVLRLSTSLSFNAWTWITWSLYGCSFKFSCNILLKLRRNNPNDGACRRAERCGLCPLEAFTAWIVSAVRTVLLSPICFKFNIWSCCFKSLHPFLHSVGPRDHIMTLKFTLYSFTTLFLWYAFIVKASCSPVYCSIVTEMASSTIHSHGLIVLSNLTMTLYYAIQNLPFPPTTLYIMY